jgi:urease accessory protein UreE
VFRTIPTAESVHRADVLPDSTGGFARDRIVLGWEERQKTRGRRVTEGGVEFGLALPRGSVLRTGDSLILESISTIVEIVERLEPAFFIAPRSPAEWGLFAYHIGNGHQPLMITEHGLVCPEVPGVELLLQYHRIPYERTQVAFTPTAASGHVVV